MQGMIRVIGGLVLSMAAVGALDSVNTNVFVAAGVGLIGLASVLSGVGAMQRVRG